MPEELSKLLAALTRHELALGSAAQMLGFQAQLIEKLLPKCEDCTQPCTILLKNGHSRFAFCDACVARMIVVHKLSEDTFVDLPEAESIRKVQDYLRLLKQVDEQERTVH